MTIRSAAALLLLALLPSAGAQAQQSDVSTNAMYVEVGGSGLLYSINYEGRLSSLMSARVGFMAQNQTIVFGDGSETVVGVLLVPVMANVLVGGGSHRLEIGAGPLVGVAGTGVTGVRRGGAEVVLRDIQVAGFTSSFGYRYHPVRGGILIRAVATPFYSGSSAQLWGGISLGWAM
jgi:hypothetical protein